MAAKDSVVLVTASTCVSFALFLHKAIFCHKLILTIPVSCAFYTVCMNTSSVCKAALISSPTAVANKGKDEWFVYALHLTNSSAREW